MYLHEYVRPLERRAALLQLARLLGLLAVILVPPGAAALLLGQPAIAATFGGLAFGAWLVGLLGKRTRALALPRREALMVTAAAYPMYAAICAVVFVPVAGYGDGFFESLSGLTTTGLSVIDPAHLPEALLFFRSYMQWIGGAGIIVLSLILLGHRGRTADPIRTSELGVEENFQGNAVETAKLVLGVYGVLTCLGLVLLRLSGMAWLDSVTHALSAVSTGGFSSRESSLATYGMFARLVTIVLMILGATSFPLFHMRRQEGPGRFVRDEQLLGLLAAVALATLAVLVTAGGLDVSATLFDMTAAATTTGYRVVDPASWEPSKRLVALILMSVGGATGSTAGGIKIIRLILLAKVAYWLVLRTLLPEEAKVPLKLRGEPVQREEIFFAAGLVGAWAGLTAASAFALTIAGFGLSDALFESVSALGTVGLSSGVTSNDLPMWSKLVLCLNMWAGRLELFPILVLLYPGNWRFRRKAESN